MYLRRLKLRNFRNFRRGAVDLPPGVTIVIGKNGAGKTSLLEAAQFVACGRSFRTSREREMVSEGSSFFRVEAEVAWQENALVRTAAYDLEAGVRVDSGGGAGWLPAGSVLCFSPDDLQLIKGSPAGRRRFLDDTISRRLPSYHRALLDYQKVLAQRNSFLQRAKAGIARLSDISPWDRQLSSLGVKIHAARGEHCRRLAPHFQTAYREIAGAATGTCIHYDSQLNELGDGDDLEEKLVLALAARWSADLERLSSGTGVHRDDVDFRLAGRSLKPYGSQGEQRSAVLSLLLADRRLGMETGETPLLLLDDVMSELDPDRRRRLLAALVASEDGLVAGMNGTADTGAGTSQTIITAADTGLFTEDELASAGVVEVENGIIREARVGANVEI